MSRSSTNICGEKFTQSSNLKKHSYIHADEKKYKCNMCEETFTNISDLNKHKFTHIA